MFTYWIYLLLYGIPFPKNINHSVEDEKLFNTDYYYSFCYCRMQ